MSDLQAQLSQGASAPVEKAARKAGLPKLRRLTALLTASCVALLAVSYACGGEESHAAVLYLLGAGSYHALRGGEIWRLFAAAFLHADPLHLALNLWALWSFGPALEALLGWRRYLVLFAVSALGASVPGFFLSDHVLVVGASGAIWGLMTAGLGLALRPRGLMSREAIEASQRGTVPALIANLLFSLLPGVDLIGHLAGGLVGFALALTVLPWGLPALGERIEEGQVDEPSEFVRFAAILAIVAMVGSVALSVSLGRPWELGSRPDLVRLDVGQSGLSIAIPPRLARHQNRIDWNGLPHYQYGTLEDSPIALTVMVMPLGGPPTPEKLEEMVEQQRAAIENSRGEGGLPVKLEQSERLTIRGQPAIRARYTLQGGLRVTQYVRVVYGAEVGLMIYAGPYRPPAWEGVEDQIAESAQLSDGMLAPSR
jgi:membrane associated rhomboid family serine protease